MGAHREPQHEEEPEPVTAAAPGPARPALPAGLSPRTLSRAQVIALQRLVGNAAVVEMIDARGRPEADHPGSAEPEPGATVAGEAEPEPPGGELPGAPGAGAIDGRIGDPAEAGAPGSAPEAAGSAAANGAGATQADGAAPGSTDAGAQDVEPVEAPAAGGASTDPGAPDAEPVAAAAAEGAGAQPDEADAPANGAVQAPDAAPSAPGAAAGPAVGAAVAPGAAGSPVAAAAVAPGAAAGPAAVAPGTAAGPAVTAAVPGAVAGASDAGAPAPTAAAAPAGPAAPGDIRDPHDDPGFKAMTGAAKGAGARAKTHQPAAAGAATAQGAAVPPANDVPSQAAAAQVDEMGKQQPGVFDKQAFIAAVKQAIDAAAPKNLEEADDFKGSGKAGKAKDEIHAQVKGGKQESEKNIKQATDAAPDQSKAKPKTVTPMVNDEPGAPPGDVGAAGAMPGPRPPQQTDLSGGPAQIDAKMAEADVTEEQIKKSNEPEFDAALEARDGARKQSAAAPAEYRAKEQDVLAKGRGEAEATAGAELQGMHGVRAQALAKVVGKKGETKSADEEKRAKVATDIQGIYDRTKADVTKTLDGLDGKVDAAFTKGEGAARSEFESYVDKRMSDYKHKRYGGFWGKGRWIKDKLAGMPDEVNKFYEDGKRSYLTAMDAVIGEIADIVGTELTAARTRIAQGRGEVQKYVAQLPADLREVGKEAEGKLESQFEQLSSDVDAKQDAMVDKLAQKYVEARDKLDARIDELKAANKGLVDKALDAVVGVVKTILKLKDMLMGVLSRAAGAIGDILKDPIGFLGNLVAGVKGGLMRFVDNIAGHLQEGLMGWLFGALGGAGLTLPKALDFAGILDLVTQVLGLTYQNVRARLAKLVGEPLVAKMERTVDVIRDFATKGIAGAWEWIKDKIGDLEEMVLGEIKEWVIFKVIKAGVLWIVSLLNPASAFVKACKAIYDIVMFIVERGSEIMAFVNSVLDSIASIAKGSLGGVAEKVEGALAKALPLAISFLASLLGLGGISDKIRGVIDKVRSPINKAIDTVVGGAVKTFKKMFGPALKWAKKKFEKGKAFVKGKVEAGKKWVKGKVEGARRLIGVGRAMSFTAAGEGHKLWYATSGGLAKLMVASQAMPVEERFAEMRRRVSLASPDQQALAQPLLAQGDALVASAAPKAQSLAQAVETRRAKGEVDDSVVLKDEKDVVAAEAALVPVLEKLFEILGVGEKDKLVDVPAPSGKTIRCVKRGNAIVPIGKVAIFLMGLVGRAPKEELRTINDQLQSGIRDKALRKELETRRKKIRDGLKHNAERSQQMWEMVQGAGLDDSVDNVNAIISTLLKAGAEPELSQELTVEAPGGGLKLEPKWTVLPDGDRYLSTVIIKGLAAPPKD
jgi:hypothetical protein